MDRICVQPKRNVFDKGSSAQVRSNQPKQETQWTAEQWTKWEVRALLRVISAELEKQENPQQEELS